MPFYAGPLTATKAPTTGAAPSSAPAAKPLTPGKVFSAGPLPAADAGAKQPDLATNLGAGLLESIFGTANGLFNLGNDALNLPKKIGLPGLGVDASTFGPSKTIERVATPKNTQQSVGKAAGDIAQFFIPGGAEKAAASKIGEGVDALKLGETIGPKAGDVVGNILKTLGSGAATGASMAGVTAAQGGSAQDTGGAFLLGGGAGIAGKALETFGPSLTEALQKADFKLSPAASAKASAKADSAAAFMTDNKILGSQGAKYEKLNGLTGNLEDTLQKSVPDLNVKKADIVDQINQNVESIRTSNPAVYASARADADEAIKTLGGKLQPDGTYTFSGGNTIKSEDTLTGKRSWGQQAFRSSKFATKDPKVNSEGAYAIELAYQKAFSDSLDRVGGEISIPKSLQSYFGGAKTASLSDFNKVYSDAITSRNLTFMSQFKKDSGLIGRLFGLWAGSALGETIMPGLPGKILGGTAGELASTHLPGLIRNALERIGSASGSTIPTLTKGYAGASAGTGSGNPFVQLGTLLGYPNQ